MLKTTKEKIKEELGSSGIEFEEVEWNENALIIKNVVEDEINALEESRNKIKIIRNKYFK